MKWLLCNSSSSSCSTGNPWLWLFWLVSLNLRKLPFSHNGFWNTMWLLCHVMSCWHSTLFCTDWFILCFVEIDWLETNYPDFFNNLDTCIVAVVKVSDDTIQLIINWIITLFRQIMTRLSHCISKSIFRKCPEFSQELTNFPLNFGETYQKKKSKEFSMLKEKERECQRSHVREKKKH